MNEFEVSVRKRDDIAVLDVKGYLDAHTAPQLEQAFQRNIDDRQFNIVVNFQHLNYISSAGLGVLMQFIEEIRVNEGDIKLSNMSPRVFNVFDLLGFPMLYEIFNSEDEAVAQFQNNSEKQS